MSPATRKFAANHGKRQSFDGRVKTGATSAGEFDLWAVVVLTAVGGKLIARI